MATINYTKLLTGKDFSVPTDHFEIIGRILVDQTTGAADSLNATINRKGFAIGQIRLSNGVLTYRYDDYLSSEEQEELVIAATAILNDSVE